MDVARAPAPLMHYIPIAALLAAAAHLIVVALFLTQDNEVEPAGGGGGQVLGQLAISLGGTGAAGPRTTQDTPPAIAPEAKQVESEPEPREERAVPRPDPARQEIASPPPARTAPAKIEPAKTETTRTKPAEWPEQNREPRPQVVESVSGETGDGRPVGATTSATPTLGEGAPAQTVGTGAQTGRAGDALDAYLALIRSRVETNRTYPSAARRQRAEGEVVVRMSIGAGGQLSSVEIIQGASSFHLDRAAKRMVEKSAPFPPPPSTPFTTIIPIVFALR